MQQAPPAIFLAAVRRFRGPALFRGLRPSSRQGVAFWPSGLTVRRSRPPTAAAELRALVPSPVSCAHPPVPALGPVPKASKPFWPPALVQQAPPAIILAVLRRFRGPALFRGPRPSSRQGVPSWPSGLTVRRSRPPTAAAELRALAPLKTHLFRPCLFKRQSIFQALCSAGFVVSLGFAWWRYAGLWSFWPLALV